ncbi:MAG: LysR family transcriptional regulator [Frisingicoccus sp.]|uniref:LysR family transcriptional regulator n=2 Tax=Frisingicoccus sp. TaxID=1918627 RepID=UPI002A809BE2|nr:LysR family transcriptional regulator [Frisingicoccus sp.]MDY4834252.1 LysR family transcriptional regulator [Frisingicoccus sp.]MDY5956977.1 LysR family transcriptional regulator [Frisingicoccus sp.]
MDINYELYKVFYYVAKTLSFSEASKKLFISQSAVSQSIKALEKKLDQTLFIRSTKRVKLTPEGEILFKHIEPAVNLIIRGENQIMDANDLNGGQLRIGATDTICRYHLVPYLKEFHEHFPNVHIKVTNATSSRCVDLLENEVVDLVVTNYPNPRMNSIQNVRKIHEFHDVFIANQNYAHLKNKRLELEELLGYPILMLDKVSMTSEFLHSLFQQHQLDLVPEIELSSNDLLIDLARIGLGIAFIPDFCLPENDPDLFIIRTREMLPTRQLVAGYNDKVPLSEAAQYFIDILS